ncbi:MAG: enolase C-terminal domain-like protein [Enterocloster sp.]
MREDIKVVEAVRGAIGDKMEIMVDGNQAWKMPWDVECIWDLKKAVKVARELEKLGSILAGGAASTMRITTIWPA